MQLEMVHHRTVTIEQTTAASMIIRIVQPQNVSLHRALAKAESRLIDHAWRLDSGVLHITSHSTPGAVQLCDGDSCSCETTRGICWHIAAWTILSTLSAAGSPLVASLPLPMVLDVDELPDSFLDGDFSAFEDTSILNIQVEGPVQPWRLQPSVVIPNPLDALVDDLAA